MTLRQAVDFAKRCRDANRAYRLALVAPFPAPAWLPPTFTENRYEWNAETCEGADVETVRDTVAAWGEHVAAYQTTESALQAYKPRIQWPSYVASLAKEAGLSLAAYKRANPDRGFPIRGPQFDKLKEAKRVAFNRLDSFLTGRCTAYLTAHHYRAYSRARLLLRTWPQRRDDLESQIRESTATREHAEG